MFYTKYVIKPNNKVFKIILFIDSLVCIAALCCLFISPYDTTKEKIIIGFSLLGSDLIILVISFFSLLFSWKYQKRIIYEFGTVFFLFGSSLIIIFSIVNLILGELVYMISVMIFGQIFFAGLYHRLVVWKEDKFEIIEEDKLHKST